MANFGELLQRGIENFEQPPNRGSITVEQYVDRIGVLAISKQFHDGPGTGSAEQACVSWNNLANCLCAQSKETDRHFFTLRKNWSGEAAEKTLNNISMYSSWLNENYKKTAHPVEIIWESSQLFNAICGKVVEPELVEKNRSDLAICQENLSLLTATNLLNNNNIAISECQNAILSLEEEYEVWRTSIVFALKQYGANAVVLQSRLYPFPELEQNV